MRKNGCRIFCPFYFPLQTTSGKQRFYREWMKILLTKKLFKFFSKVLCDTIPASFRRFYRKIALLFSSKKRQKPARKPVSNVLRKKIKQLLKKSPSFLRSHLKFL